MIAFDLPTPEDRDAVIARAYEERLLLLPCGTRSIRLRPHLSGGRRLQVVVVEVMLLLLLLEMVPIVVAILRRRRLLRVGVVRV